MWLLLQVPSCLSVPWQLITGGGWGMGTKPKGLLQVCVCFFPSVAKEQFVLKLAASRSDPKPWVPQSLFLQAPAVLWLCN